MAVAGAAGAAEGQVNLGADGAGIYIDDAGGYLFHRLKRHVNVARVDGGDQPVGDVVVDGHRLFEVGDRDNIGHGPEDLLLGDAHLGSYAREHGGLEEVAFVQTIAGGARTADGDGGALFATDLHVSLHLLQLRPVHQRADVRCLVQAVAEAQGFGAGDELLGEGVQHALLDDHAAGSGAALAAGAEGAPHSALDRQVDVGVAEDDDGVLAAHLQVHAFAVSAAVGGDLAAHLDGAGEGDHRHPRVAHQSGAGIVLPEKEVDDAGRQAGLLQDAQQVSRAEGRVGRGLKDDGVARDQRRH